MVIYCLQFSSFAPGTTQQFSLGTGITRSVSVGRPFSEALRPCAAADLRCKSTTFDRCTYIPRVRLSVGENAVTFKDKQRPSTAVADRRR